MTENPIVKLGRYGTIGVILASLIVVMFFGGIIYKIVTEHSQRANAVIDRNTDAWIEHAQVSSELKTTIQDKLR